MIKLIDLISKGFIFLWDDCIVPLFSEVGYFVVKNLYFMSIVLKIATPYLFLLIVCDLYNSRGYFGFGGEYAFPIVMYILIYIMQRIANKNNAGNGIPTYPKRFTEETSDGGVSVNQDDIQEMLLYMADVENYLERNGYAEYKK